MNVALKYQKLTILLFILFAAACDTRQLEPINTAFGTDYFVLERGHYVSYNVREVRYSVNASPQTTTYQLREVVENTFADEAGGQSYRIVRYVRANGRQNWQIANVWTARLDRSGAVRTEENIPYLKLIFPLEEGKTWDGNALNTLGRKNFQMKDLGRRHTFDFRNYDETITVIQSRDSNLVNKDFRTEIYAKDVGIIYRKAENVSFCQDPSRNCLGRGIIESGLVYEQSVFDFGKLE